MRIIWRSARWTRPSETPSQSAATSTIWRGWTTSAGAIPCSPRRPRTAIISLPSSCGPTGALYDITIAYGIPLISGKDSMKNDYMIGDTKISIPPTILFSVMGKIDDVRRAVTMDVKRPGDFVYVLGVTKDELGGSEYLAARGLVGNSVPTVDITGNLRRYRALFRAVGEHVVASAHDVSDGGLGVSLAEVALAGDLGIEVGLAGVPREGITREDGILFSESAGSLRRDGTARACSEVRRDHGGHGVRPGWSCDG